MAVLVATLVASEFVKGAAEMVQATTSIVTSLTQAYNTVQKMENTLITSSGTLIQSKKDILELRDVTDRLGISLVAAATPFAKFAASAKDLSREARFDVFEGFATALSATHAGAQQVTGTFLALQQIMSKGKVNMQDLRRQLAEHIPGAMEQARRAFGDGTASMEEFEKAVSNGLVDANTWIVKFAALMEEEFGDAAARAALSLESAMNKIGTAFTLAQAKIVETSGAGEQWKEMLDTLRISILDNEDIQNKLSEALSNTNTAVQGVIDILPEAITLLGTLANRASTGVGLLSTVVGGVLNKLDTLTTHAGYAAGSLKQLWDEANGSLDIVPVKIEAVVVKIKRVSTAAQALAQIEAEEDAKAADRLRTAIEIADVKGKLAEAEKGRLEELQNLYDQTGIATEEYLDKMRQGYIEAAGAFKEFMTEAERLEWVEEKMQKLIEGTKEFKEASIAAKEEAARIAEEEKRAAEEAEKLAAEQEKVAAASEKAAAATKRLADNEKEATAAAKDRINTEGRIVNRDATGGGEEEESKAATLQMSAHGNALSDQEWQALPQQMRDFLTASRLEGSSSYDYFSNSTGNRFSGEQGYTKEWAAFTARAASDLLSMGSGGGTNITNNFNSSISRSDVVNIIEEQNRISQRT